VGMHGCIGRLAVHCCDLTVLVSSGFQTQRGLTTHGQLFAHPHPQSRPTLRAAGSLQGVPPSCCGRRAAGVEWVCRHDPTLCGHKRLDAQAACEPAGGGRRGVPVHPSRLQHPPYVPRPSLLTISIDIRISNAALALPPSRIWCRVCTSGSLRAERGLGGGCEGGAVGVGFWRDHP
jgi:hypothetical protein